MTAFGGEGDTGPVDGEALDWALRMTDPEADWEAFTAWLEGDPARAGRYDRAVVELERMTRAIPVAAPPASEDRRPLAAPPPPRSRRGWMSAAIAAALVGSVGLGVWSQRDQSYTVATRPGEQRTVELADGSSITLAGGSRVRLDGADPRSAAVEAGDMLFTVRHDAAMPFRVRAGDLTLVDLGTVFDVRTGGGRTRVAVSEGAVMVGGGGRSLRLDPGQAVVSDGRALRRERQDVAEIGGWREGLLTFSDATLDEVAAALSRHLGVAVAAAPAVGTRPFNGSIELAPLRRDPRLLGELLGVEIRRDGGGWTLDAPR
ncbi:hypothetical protein COC42_03155 [Sphingomonas spermidinifaciens]|uniref:FecR protein domain-containing protein n=1 Tax=Sphingomonas spermidinifaciens TaxID=1141889 RepID=A0A2A4B6Y8_9SPHN|nr:FecR domain-containing protein [Sphingomonas spermidinifaciens]PCD03406.1 hypothetical protein COC42_03155 [Sphingomonas spermidinifaciens]